MNIVKVKEKKLSTRLSSALSRAKKRLAEVKEAQALPEALPGEVFIEQAQCGSTGQRYAIVWHRASAAERFRIHEIVKAEGGGSNASDLAARHESADGENDQARSYALSEFDPTGRECPCCGVQGGLIYCGCGKNICRSSVYVRGGVKYCKPYGCVCDAALGNKATHSTGYAPDARAALETKKAQAKIGQEKREAIGRSNRPLLPGRRK